MTPEAAQAVDALTRSVELLGRTIAAGKGSVYLAPAAALLGALIGICGSGVLEYFRGRRQTAKERESLAGALAAELYGFLERWNETKVLPGMGRVVLRHWSAVDRFPVYDGAAGRLSLLPRELAIGTVRCYTQLGVLQEKLRWESEREAALTDATAGAKRARSAVDVPRHVQDYAARALGCAGQLASKLDEVSAGKHRPRASLGRRITRRCLRFLKGVWGRSRR